MLLIHGKQNEYLIFGHVGGFSGRLTSHHVMELESGSERFRVPKTSFQENVLVNDAVPVLTKYKNKCPVSIFAEWQRLNVAKCNLGKVNLKAMLSSWMQKACPAASATVRTIHDAYTQPLPYTGAQSFGVAQALRRDTL